MRRNPATAPIAAVEHTRGFAHEPDYVPRWPVPDETPVGAVEALIEEPAVKLMLRHEAFSADALPSHAREIAGDLAEFSHSNSSDNLLEMSAVGVSKATALAPLSEHAGSPATTCSRSAMRPTTCRCCPGRATRWRWPTPTQT